MMRAIVLLTFLVASQAAPATTAPKAALLGATKVTAVKAEPPAVKKSSPIKLGAKFDPRAGKKAVAAKSAAPLAAKKAESVKLVAKPSPLATTKVPGHVQLSAEQKKTMHWGCVTACKPSPVESKCVTACEAASYRCIDETGPGETPKDTKKCQDGVLKLYQETKGLKKEEKKKEAKKDGKKGKKEGKKVEKKADKKEKKKASSLLQVVRDDDNSDADESSEESDESSEGNSDSSEDSEESEESSDDTMDIGEQENNDDEEDKANQEAAAVEDSPMEDSATDDANEDESASDDAADESLAQVSRSTDDDDSSEDGSDDSASADESDEDSEEESDDDLRDQAMTEAANAAPADEEDQSVDSTADLKKLMDSKFGEKIPNAIEEVPSLIELKSSWKPEPCGELEPGVPCTHLYEHPQGSTVVMPCPVEQQANPEACGALFGNKADGEQCSQITCPKALGVTMKLICGGGCCPSCWAPDHVIKLDRHTSVDDAAVVDPAPQAPGTCGGVKCFKTACAAGFTEGFVNGDCCYSCVQGR